MCCREKKPKRGVDPAKVRVGEVSSGNALDGGQTRREDASKHSSERYRPRPLREKPPSRGNGQRHSGSVQPIRALLQRARSSEREANPRRVRSEVATRRVEGCSFGPPEFSARSQTLLGLATRSEYQPAEVAPLWVGRTRYAVGHFLGYAVFLGQGLQVTARVARKYLSSSFASV
jgi:hypothetical protein